ncbi:MAG: hypothetical protein A2638_00485 [Nitrospirae bacterium RIFCSPHIGHO2_01_FULL_66_17]|nr:MAG: hypothetical protein A2638_00485 [Nitrospirae bacterium RIFCSPHIGHO2_01_FULL_66_17]
MDKASKRRDPIHPIRALMVGAGLVALFWSMPSSGAERTTPTAPPEFLALKNPVPVTPEALGDAALLYKKKCKKCHGADGKGRGSATKGMKIKPRDYTDGKLMSTLVDGQLVWIILNGSDRETTEMEGFNGKITDAEAWNLVHYIRSFAHNRNNQEEGVR